MREIKISIETAQRWANGTDEELKGMALQTYPELAKKELPKSWEELEFINGHYLDAFSISHYLKELPRKDNKNTFATKEQAEASIALAQLSQLRAVYRNGWVPDWSDDELKCLIENYVYNNSFFSFQDAETRDLFLENFRDLIEKAKPLFT